MVKVVTSIRSPSWDYIYLELFYNQYKLARVYLIYSFVRLSARHGRGDNKMLAYLISPLKNRCFVRKRARPRESREGMQRNSRVPRFFVSVICA